MLRAARTGAWVDILRRFGSDGTVVALSIILLLAIIIIPLPRILLDLLIATNLVFAVFLLISSLLHRQPSKLSAFPTVLLFATLLRLAVNVSSTRLILLYGDQGLGVAGTIIQAFGEVVVRGNFLVGAIIFAIIALVNFLVVAKGSSRVAEVAARFTLDSVPGRQLAIDADVRLGKITPEDASRLREELSRESQFFGAMDGAMKFVQGDAIAGFLIVAVNAIGGFGLGVSRGLSWQDSLMTFGVLAIGDGLVNCLPSLLTSLASGFVVTHVQQENSQSSGGQVFSQFLENGQVLVITSLAFFLLAILPGMPILPFFLMGGFLLLLGFFSGTLRGVLPVHVLQVAEVDRGMLPGAKRELLDGEKKALPVPSATFYEIVPLQIVLSEDLLRMSDQWTYHSEMFSRFIESHRDEFYRDTGVRFPGVSFSFVKNQEVDAYSLQLRENSIRTGKIHWGEIFVPTAPATLAVFGFQNTESARHPHDYRLCSWVRSEPSLAPVLNRLSIRGFEPMEYLALEVFSIARLFVDELFGIDECRNEMRSFEQRYPSLYEELFGRGVLSFPEVTEVLRRLLRERLSIRDLKSILEGAASFLANSGVSENRSEWIDSLSEYVRRTCVRAFPEEAKSPGGEIRAFLLSPSVEEEFQSSMSSWNRLAGRLPLDPDFEQQLRDASRAMFSPVLERGALPVVVICAAEIRLGLHDFLRRVFPCPGWFFTFAFEELVESAEPEIVGVLTC